jgi:hypothetical protein
MLPRLASDFHSRLQDAAITENRPMASDLMRELSDALEDVPAGQRKIIAELCITRAAGAASYEGRKRIENFLLSLDWPTRGN